ncbi:MAG: chemotaxis protein CheR [Desulfuromonadaceae bacterium]|nr:chemotaxis protein CheR [Desulfuromonadaceae bacterium]MDD5105950.1 chemotaxis protein CheR [Desulfuromonadaceae bacterium]
MIPAAPYNGPGHDPVVFGGLLADDVDRTFFDGAIRRLYYLFDIYARTCPVPIPAQGLHITTEIRAQCERYLPISDIAATFNHLFHRALTYPPILSSTPFYCALSWADAFAILPKKFQFSANPARLLESLLIDSDMLTRFLFASFLPNRFYGGIGRYPEQQGFIRKWLARRNDKHLSCLDSACGSGEETYSLMLLIKEQGVAPVQILVEGWTLEPLEVWAATHRRFPHDVRREERLRTATATLISEGYSDRVTFSCQDITQLHLGKSDRQAEFNLILCNGLLGGPIMRDQDDLERSVANLARMLAPGGILLAADHFHGGWKRQYPQSFLRALFEQYGLKPFVAGEGIGGLKSD